MRFQSSLEYTSILALMIFLMPLCLAHAGPGTCGDTVCDVTENNCSCPEDCPGTLNSLIGVDRRAIFSLNPATGDGTRLTGPGLDGFFISGAAFDPDTQTLYLADPRENALLRVDTATREITVVGQFDASSVSGLAFDPNTQTLFASDAAHSGSQLLRLDTSTGTSTFIGNIGFDDVFGLAFDRTTNTLYGVDHATSLLITIDTIAGTGTTVGPIGFDDIAGLTIDSNSGTLYGSDTSSDELIIINKSTGAGTAVGPSGRQVLNALAYDDTSNTLFGVDTSTGIITLDTQTAGSTSFKFLGIHSVIGLAYDSTTNTTYAIDANTRLLITIDLNDAVATPIGEVEVGGLTGLAFSPSDQLLYASTFGMLYTIDPITANHTFIGSTNTFGVGPVNGLTFNSNTDTLYGVTLNGNLIALDTTTGVGTLIGNVGFNQMASLSFDPATNVLYGTSNSESSFIRIDPQTGQGTTVAALSKDFFSLIQALTFDSSSGRLVAFDTNTDSLFGIAIDTGFVQFIGPDNVGFLTSLAFDALTNTLYGVVSQSSTLLVTVDPLTGTSTPIAELSEELVQASAFDPNARVLYAVTLNSGELLQFDVATQTLTTIGTTGLLVVHGLAFDPVSGLLYASTPAPGTRLFTINPQTAESSQLDFHIFVRHTGLAFDAQNGVLYGVENDDLYTFDTVTGQPTFVGATPGLNLDGLTFAPGEFACNDGIDNDCDGNVDCADTDCSGDAECCGDGVVDPSQECDDGNRTSGDGCSEFCITEFCGDGIVNNGSEACDDSGTSATCDDDCTLPVCGDGTLNTLAGEACDDGLANGNTPNACRMSCQLPACGDGVVDNGEACDTGGSSATCNDNCTQSECGDGVVNTMAGEACDDAGPSVNCDDDCTLANCGDGRLNILAGEECDDGNTNNGDGCSANCKIESAVAIPAISLPGMLSLIILLTSALAIRSWHQLAI